MSEQWLRRIGWLALLLLAVSLPFELDQPLFTVGPLAVTNVELLLFAVLTLAGGLWLWQRPSLSTDEWWWLLLVGTGVLFLVTAVLAPSHTENAVKAALRLIGGMALAFAIPLLVRTPSDRNRLIGAVLAGSLLATAIGLVEVAGGRELAWLSPLRSGATVTGQFIRLTGPFDYANQAAMYVEATIPLLLVGAYLVWRKQGITMAVLGFFIAILLMVQASFMTLSRASFVTIGLVGVTIAFILTWRQQTTARPARPWLGLALLVVVLFAVNTAASDVFRLRFRSEGDNDWYRASWQVPDTLTIPANTIRQAPVTVTNEGALTWRGDRAQPIRLGARWIQKESGQQVSEPRFPFTRPVPPGETIRMEAPLRAPSIPGEYTLIWDVVQEQVTWFGAKSGVYATSDVVVLPSEKEMVPGETAVDAWTYPLPIPPRRTLWLTALQLIETRPFLGIGLDNFRLTYGALLNADKWNETIHTNNWYLEILVGAGLLGALPFFTWLLMLAIDGVRVLRAPPVDPWQTAIAAGLLAFAIHGLLDFFLLFNGAGLLFWLLVGLWRQSKTVTTKPFFNGTAETQGTPR